VCHVQHRVRVGELPVDRRRGGRIADARVNLGFTQEQLARLVGVQRGAVNRWEGGASMRVERIQPLADALHVDPEWIVGGPLPAMPAEPVIVSDPGGTHHPSQLDEIQALLEVLAGEVAELAARGTEQPPEERVRRLLEEAARLAARRT
jgi:transcriptional regulator with XRE-family HTH domain